MIRMIAADIDGTLTDASHGISERTIKAIEYAQSKGVIFVISTGRMYQSAKSMMDRYGIRCSYLCNSGAQIFDENGVLLRDLPMKPRLAEWVLTLFDKWKLPADIQADESLYLSSTLWQKFERAWRFARRGMLLPFLIRNFSYYKTDGSVVKLKKAKDVLNKTDHIYKISASGIDPRRVEKIKAYFQKSGRVHAVSSFSDNVEITDVNAQKGESVAWYAAKLGISPEEVMTIGDSDNDLSMLAWDFGYTVAMGNGMDTVKAAAKYIALPNTEDGVARFIEEHI